MQCEIYQTRIIANGPNTELITEWHLMSTYRRVPRDAARRVDAISKGTPQSRCAESASSRESKCPLRSSCRKSWSVANNDRIIFRSALLLLLYNSVVRCDMVNSFSLFYSNHCLVTVLTPSTNFAPAASCSVISAFSIILVSSLSCRVQISDIA